MRIAAAHSIMADGAPTATDGKVEVPIPSGLADGTYTLYMCSAGQYNGGEQDDTKLTDYAAAG